MNNKLIKTAAITGLAAAIGVFLYLFCLHVFGLNPFARFKYLYLGIYALFFVFGMQHFRDKQNEHKMSATNGIGFGFLLTVVASLFCGVFVLVFLNSNYGHSAFELHSRESIELLEASKDFIVEQMGQEAYRQTAENLRGMTTAELALDQSIGMSLSGVFLTFLFMLIFKN